MTSENNRHTQLLVVVDDAERTDSELLHALSSEQFTLSVNVILPEMSPVRAPQGIHYSFDEGEPRLGIFGQGKAMHRLREMYESPTAHSVMKRAVELFGKFQTVYQLSHREMQRQNGIFEARYGVIPQHASTHNGWWEFENMMRSLQCIGEKNDMLIRIARQYISNYQLSYLPYETGLVVDAHNVHQHRNVLQSSTTFLDFLKTSIPSKAKRAEVVIHAHGEHTSQGTFFAQRDTVFELCRNGFTIVSPEDYKKIRN